MPGEDIGEILARLNSGRVEGAWKTFLKIYSPVIMQVVRRYESDRERANDCFLFVCEKLSDDGFRRLLAFDADRGAAFATWLKAVVSNLCVDRHRTGSGRPRPFRAVTRLSRFDQRVYRCNFELGMNLEACLNTLRIDYPEVTRDQLAAAIGRVHSALSSRQRWQLSFRRRETGAIRGPGAGGSHSTELIESGPGPEALAHLQQERKMLLQAMSKLTHQQRLLLRLRYQEDLPLKEVARLAGLKDPYQARYRIESAIAALGELLAPPHPPA